jgi:hypothetical protein
MEFHTRKIDTAARVPQPTKQAILGSRGGFGGPKFEIAKSGWVPQRLFCWNDRAAACDEYPKSPLSLTSS